MLKILLVCTGNTCRSPMASVLLENIWSKRLPEKEIKIKSAGLFTGDGLPASSEAIEVMQEYGLDLSNHKSRQITEDLVKEADIILTMTNSHLFAMLEMFPDYAPIIFTISEYINHDGEVEDPYGRGIEAYHTTAQELAFIVNELIDTLLKEWGE